ncbi:MAG: 1-deoxy-D-xylulose-5-phosphate synthase [Clostridia bacterium]|nr:1-deoxy-D-xylulose-5-phosphate synthase [Clostridia bacterium]
MLNEIRSPKDIKNMTYAELDALAGEIRETIISTVSKNGGHLASNLGMVEATIALHRVFNTPEDKIIFDVSHQCYTHKLLTGRQNDFTSLRLHNGISGFTSPTESEYDTVIAGHSGTSISTALGFAQAARITGSDRWAVAVIGDGSFTNGMAYEALNNCGDSGLNLIILLNDNEMSISKNVGGMHHSLSTIRTSKRYFAFKHMVKNLCKSIPVIGEALVNGARNIRDFAKRLAVNYNIFESLGCDYIGPVDGNNIKKLEDALEEAKTKHRASVVHIITKKGKGYAPAEEHPENYHSTPAFDINKGLQPTSETGFSSEFGKYMCELAQKDKRICAVTAAMIDGTGLREFANSYPDRFFDTAISEEHAATFSAGLTKAGLRPVFAVYSTFAQRIYDQIFHDGALQKLPLVIALDRAGIVGADGATHQGLYDYSLFSGIPGIRIYSPETYDEMHRSFDAAFDGDSPAIVRYPRGKESSYDRSAFSDLGDLTVMGTNPADVVIITYGRICEQAYNAARILEKAGIHVRIVKLIMISPLNTDRILALTKDVKLVYLLEEGIRSGSVAEKIASAMSEGQSKGVKCIIRAINNTFVSHGSQSELFEEYGLDFPSVAKEIYDTLK